MVIKRCVSRQSGFSLLELLIALVILGFVLAGVTFMFTSTGRYHTGQEMMVELVQDIRAAKMMMADEIRMAGCNPVNKVRVGFQNSGDDHYNTDANSIHFTRDIDNGDGDQFFEPDGDVMDTDEDIAYFRTNDDCSPGTVGAILAAGVNTPGCLRRYDPSRGAQAVAKNITDLRFQYYRSDGSEITAAMTSNSLLDQIHSVRVTISGQVQNTALIQAGNQTWTQQFLVRVRNM